MGARGVSPCRTLPRYWWVHLQLDDAFWPVQKAFAFHTEFDVLSLRNGEVEVSRKTLDDFMALYMSSSTSCAHTAVSTAVFPTKGNL